MGFAFTDIEEQNCNLENQVVSEKTRYGNFFANRATSLGEIDSKSLINTKENQPYNYESASGVFYYGYRYYKADTGKWLNRDPIEERGGINLQAFVNNNGVNYWDYLGFRSYKAIAPRDFMSEMMGGRMPQVRAVARGSSASYGGGGGELVDGFLAGEDPCYNGGSGGSGSGDDDSLLSFTQGLTLSLGFVSIGFGMQIVTDANGNTSKYLYGELGVGLGIGGALTTETGAIDTNSLNNVEGVGLSVTAFAAGGVKGVAGGVFSDGGNNALTGASAGHAGGGGAGISANATYTFKL